MTARGHATDAELRLTVAEWKRARGPADRSRLAGRVMAELERLLWLVARGSRPAGMSHDEAVQAARVGVLHALRTWDEAKAGRTTFAGYAARRARSSVREHALRELGGPVRAPRGRRTVSVPWDAGDDPDDTWPDAPGDVLAFRHGPGVRPDVTDALDLGTAARLARERLSPRERELFVRYLADEPHADVARSLGISRQSVTETVRRAHVKLRAAGRALGT